MRNCITLGKVVDAGYAELQSAAVGSVIHFDIESTILLRLLELL